MYIYSYKISNARELLKLPKNKTRKKKIMFSFPFENFHV